MNTPQIKYYAQMCLQDGTKTPKYTITKAVGFMPEMEQLRGKDGRISFYLTEKLREGENVPSMRLQGKNSLNVTGLKEWFADGGKLSGYAYGYPLSTQTYSSKNRPNPLYPCKSDGFLFLVSEPGEQGGVTPKAIEMLVLTGAKSLVAAFCKMLAVGGFDEALRQLREQAQPL